MARSARLNSSISDDAAIIFATVLAAGGATRFGSTKQIAELDGKPLIRYATDTAQSACGARVVVVAGHEWQKVIDVAGTNVHFFAINELAEDGIGTSIAVAAGVCASRADAMLLLHCDQPLITADHLNSLIRKWSGDEHEIVATAFAETMGPPVLFPQGAFADLMALSGDKGARALFNDNRFKVRSVSFEDAAVDVDTVKQLDALQGIVASRQ